MKQIDGHTEMDTDYDMSTDNNDFDDLSDTSDLPKSVIVTNTDIRVFTESDLRIVFEDIFKKFEENATFQYFKSFRRVRVNFESALSAASARIQCHQIKIGNEIINCYFAGPTLTNRTKYESPDHLHPPAPQRQFLISPPASPPVGWEPADEATPCINVELLTALASLSPGESHELHPQSESQPGIVVHICEEEDSDWRPKIRIAQTSRPGAIQRSSSEGSEDSLCSTPPENA